MPSPSSETRNTIIAYQTSPLARINASNWVPIAHPSSAPVIPHGATQVQIAVIRNTNDRHVLLLGPRSHPPKPVSDLLVSVKPLHRGQGTPILSQMPITAYLAFVKKELPIQLGRETHRHQKVAYHLRKRVTITLVVPFH